MTDDEEAKLRSVYDKDGDNYRLNVKKSSELDELDDEFSMAFILNNQMSAVEESKFKSQMAAQMGVDEQVMANMTVEQIGAQMGVELTTFTRQEEDSDGNMVDTTCVDMRQIFKTMYNTGMMSKDDIIAMRDEMEETFSSVGSTLIKSMGVAYAKNMDEKAGLDMDDIQKSYLLNSGLKMIGMALLMAVVTVIVGLIASKIGYRRNHLIASK